ncbi:hypothetical protein ACQ4PT_030256 [Festuca glaucescens]
MAAPPRGTFSSRAFSAAYMVATAAPPRVRFAALYLLLGALWLANASTIAKAFERCLGVDCFILDRECRLSLAFPVIGVMSLFLLRGHWRRLSEAREDAVGAHVDLPPEGPSQEPGRACPPVGNMGHRNDLDMHLAVCVFAAWAMLGLQGLGISSTASIEQAPPNPVNSDDPAWKYSTLPDTSKKNALQCNFCGKICTNGVTRLKFHLACIKGFNVKPCPKVPTDVMQEMIKFLLASNDANCKKVEALEKLRSTVNLDHSEGEETDEDDNNALVVLKPKPSSAASTSSHKGGSINKFFKPSSVEESVKKKSLGEKTQMKLSTQEREQKRNRACEYICQWFYEASIPHNAVTLPSFACMLEAIGRFGKDLQGPSAYEMSGPFLQKRKKRVMDTFKGHKETWELTGCTVMTDAWTDRKSRGVMNLVVHSVHGALFLKSVDCSADKKDGRYIFDLVDQCIEDIGPENVVQVVTDNASVNIAASAMLKAKRPSIYWNGCAAHTIDLMLEDIGKLGPVDKTICQARQVTVFLYAHIRVLALMRSTLNRDLVRSGVTRFATAYLNLRSLLDNKNGLQKLFRSEELHEMGYLKKAKGDKAQQVVKSESFWKRVNIAVNYFEPMANVLRRMDSDVPAMGFLYGCMLDAKKEILMRFNNDESRCKTVLDIIDNRWDNRLKKPLHLAGYFLNPYYYYPNKVEIEKAGKFRAAVISCITTMIADDEEQDMMIEELKLYRAAKDSFGTDIATRQRKNKNFDPASWWLNHGTCSPHLKNLAVKILSLTCSSSACERNFSAFEQVHAKKRSRLRSDRLNDLVFVRVNSRLIDKKENKRRDPIEKIIEDVLEDEENEFITGIVPEDNVPVEQEQPDIEPEASTSQAQSVRHAHVRKKRKKSIHALLNAVPEDAVLSESSDSSSSEREGNQSQPDVLISDASSDSD